MARVAVDVPLAHLDRPFDYTVTASQATAAVPGARVRVGFAGRVVGGFVLDRRADSEHPGRLSRLSRVVSAEPVLSAEVAGLARRVADRYAGTLADVLRLAVPPRHARVEAQPSPPRPAWTSVVPPGPWADVTGGAAWLRALAAGRPARAVWSAPPGAPGRPDDWPEALARAALTTLAGGRGALLVLPDHRDVERVDAALRGLAGEQPRHVVLSADLGPAERYRRWLAVRRGAVRVVVGTRAAAFAPVADLGLVACWDDGDDSHAEPRAPYPHAREVLLLRAHITGCAALIGGFARTAEAAHLVATGWARPLEVPRDRVRRRAPALRVAGGEDELARDAAATSARLPGTALRAVRAALERGPVLVQSPRAGYLPALACAACRAAARCRRCGGPLALPTARGVPACSWCRTAEPEHRCAVCGSAGLRAASTGGRRTAEELARALPGVAVATAPLDPGTAAIGATGLVVATPGLEPPVEGGYAAALLLDGTRLLARRGLRAGEEALRRWFNAAALVRSEADGGVVVVVAPGRHPAVQALLRWDPAGAAERELADRAAAGFPPAARVAELTGAADDVADLQAAVVAAVGLPQGLPPALTVLGPLPDPTPEEPQRTTVLLRVPLPAGTALARHVQQAQATRTAAKRAGSVRVRVDPVDLA